MAKRAKKKRSSKRERPVSNADQESLENEFTSRLVINACEEEKKSDDAPNEGKSEIILHPFGLDNVCQQCCQLYVNVLSKLQPDACRTLETSLPLGALPHIHTEIDCCLCQQLFKLRWDDSDTGDYHLHAFSAARVICGQLVDTIDTNLASTSAKHIKGSLSDNVLLVVMADCAEAVPVAGVMELFKQRGCLLSCQVDADGACLPAPMILQTEYDDDDIEHERWLNRTIGKKERYTEISIEAAMQEASRMGFINEFKKPNSWWHEGCYSTSASQLADRIKDLEHSSTRDFRLPRSYEGFFEKAQPYNFYRVYYRQDVIRGVKFLSLQPAETGDLYTPGNHGYIPHHVRGGAEPLVQSLQSTSFHSRVLAPASIDYSLLRGWIRQCRNRCDQRLSRFTKERKRFERIPFFLVDCQERRVFKVPLKRKHRYIALSYVCGESNTGIRPDSSQTPVALPEKCLEVIEDAIKVVLQLGYRYLWVDYFCISPNVSHEQIANMDVIYKNAELTIIAAAGDNALYGLPGVGSRERVQQADLKIGQHRYVEVNVNPKVSLELSSYETRGWTYQESFFSKRRLFFTDTQVFFDCRAQCKAIHCQERLCCPSKMTISHDQQPDELQDTMEDEYFARLPTNWKDVIYAADGSFTNYDISAIDKVFALLSYEHHVIEFTKRRLTFDVDSLQAVSSILDRFGYESHSIYHIHGLPFIAKSGWEYHSGAQRHSFSFNYGLLWTHGARNTSVRRRSNFPSWSWAGWVGPVNWLAGSTNSAKFHEAAESLAKFEYVCFLDSKKGRLRPIKDWRPHVKADPAPPALVFTAMLYDIPLRVSDEDRLEDRGIYLDAGDAFKNRLHVTNLVISLNAGTKMVLKGIYVGNGGNLNYVLILNEVESRGKRYGGRYFERVGVMMISRSWWGWTAPLGVQGWLV